MTGAQSQQVLPAGLDMPLLRDTSQVSAVQEDPKRRSNSRHELSGWIDVMMSSRRRDTFPGISGSEQRIARVFISEAICDGGDWSDTIKIERRRGQYERSRRAARRRGASASSNSNESYFHPTRYPFELTNPLDFKPLHRTDLQVRQTPAAAEQRSKSSACSQFEESKEEKWNRSGKLPPGIEISRVKTEEILKTEGVGKRGRLAVIEIFKASQTRKGNYSRAARRFFIHQRSWRNTSRWRPQQLSLRQRLMVIACVGDGGRREEEGRRVTSVWDRPTYVAGSARAYLKQAGTITRLAQEVSGYYRKLGALYPEAEKQKQKEDKTTEIQDPVEMNTRREMLRRDWRGE
ncbi:hypothetical protein R3P38DRAFT_2803834 [Favolaschia claudopus]|uniref:Uncharacterized protein n=1 Tax=Favolaschia claudopus TaxID=2862362 RepID=A0AAV9ZSN9_9AGAR